MPLTVPQPTLSAEGAASPFPAEKPIKIACGPVTFPDGTPLVAENAVKAEFQLFRVVLVGAVETTQAWDESKAVQNWVPIANAPAPQTLFYKDGVWQSLLVAFGAKDKAGADKFGTDPVSHHPQYFVRCSLQGKDAQGVVQDGTSPDGARAEIMPSVVGKERAGAIVIPASPAPATEIHLFLKDASLTERGTITIRSAGGVSNFEIEMKVNGASVLLDSSGQIVLTPAAGQPVHVAGPVKIQGDITMTGDVHKVPNL